MLILSLAFATAGCGSGRKEPVSDSEDKGASSEKSGKSASRAGSESGGKTSNKASSSTKTTARAAAPAAGGGTIVLTDRGCVEFAPHWTTVRVGQSITWKSELKKPVTIHVRDGAFDRGEFVVPARGTVRTGPARESGDHPMWSVPGACQAAPHGVQGAGPGVSVEPAS